MKVYTGGWGDFKKHQTAYSSDAYASCLTTKRPRRWWLLWIA